MAIRVCLFDKYYYHMRDGFERELFVSELVHWLITKVGERDRDWWSDRSGLGGGGVDSITLLRAEDATAFRLKFNL